MLKLANRDPDTALEIEVDRQQTTTAGWQIALQTSRVCTMQSYKEMTQTKKNMCLALMYSCSVLYAELCRRHSFIFCVGKFNGMPRNAMAPQRRRDLLGFEPNT